MAHEAHIFIKHILEEIEVLRMIERTGDFNKFKNDPIHFRAAAYCLQCISEAARNLPQEWLENHSHIRWREIKGIGNHTRHEYHHLKAFLIWGVIVNDLDALELVVNGLDKTHGD